MLNGLWLNVFLSKQLTKKIETMSSYTTIGYLQSKMVRIPLNLNTNWNEDINSLSSIQEIVDYIDKNGTTDEHWKLLNAIKVMEDMNKTTNLLND